MGDLGTIVIIQDCGSEDLFYGDRNENDGRSREMAAVGGQTQWEEKKAKITQIPIMFNKNSMVVILKLQKKTDHKSLKYNITAKVFHEPMA